MGYLKRRALCGAAWLAASVLLMIVSLSALQTALPGADAARLSGRYDGEGQLFTAMDRVRDELSGADAAPQARLTAWSQTRDETVSVRELNATLTVDALWVSGASDLVMNTKPLRGALPAFDGAREIALSQDAALKLFGSLDVLGQTVRCGDTDYRVVCVFERATGWLAPAADAQRALVMLPAELHKDGEDARMQALECAFPAGYTEGARQSLELWLGRANVAVPERIEDWADTRDLCAFLARLPWMLMALLGAWSLLRQGYGMLRAGIARFATLRADRVTATLHAYRALLHSVGVFALLAAAAAWMCYLGAGLPKLPPAYIPTRWSDLSFWPTLTQSAFSGLAQSALRGASHPDLQRLNLAALSALLAVASMPPLVFAGRALAQAAMIADGQAPRHTFWALSAALLAPPLAMLLARRMGYAPTAPPSAFILPTALALALILAGPVSKFIRNQEVSP